MPRFPIAIERIKDGKATISGPDYKHIVRVLRLKPGDDIILFDESGTEYKGSIIGIDTKEVTVEVEESRRVETESRLNTTLLQGIPKGEKMDFIVQKATELGVKYIVPVVSKRVVIDVSEKEQKKLSRWQRIANEAQKQCLRPSTPIILKPISIDEIFSFQDQLDCLIVPYEKEELNLLSGINNRFNRIGILIGPEGGFDVDEIEKIKCFKNIEFISLGKRILRAETASISAISIVMHLLGEM